MHDLVAIVSGGAQGIGAATARKLASIGISVYIVDVAREAGQAICNEIIRSGGSATFIEQDVLGAGGPKAAIESLLEDSGGQLNIVVNNAYFYRRGDSLADMASSRLADHLQRLLVSYHEMIVAARGALRTSECGAVVNLSSVHSWLVGDGFGSYSIAKAAVSQMTRVLASELGPEGIRVNAVAPGLIGTADTMARSEEHRNRLAFLHPLRRIGTPEDVAKAVAFLATTESSFITGQVLVVDGGSTIELPIHTANRSQVLNAEPTEGT